MEFSAQQIAQFVNGEIVGDENATVHTFAKIEEGKEGALSFLSNPKYTHYIYNTKSSIVLVDRSVTFEKDVPATLIRVDNAYEAVARLLQLYEQSKPRKTGIDPRAAIAETAEIGEDCYIGPFVTIGEGVKVGARCTLHAHATILDGATIGDDTTLYPQTTVYQGCQIGNRVIIHAGAVIGADGFGFAPTATGYDKIPQIGIVTIEDDVEIGANTCIDRSTMGSTFVRKGVKLDNLVQIAHNTDIGEHTVMSAQVGVAGSTKVGSWCMFGGQVGLAGHITIGNKVFLGAQSGVPGSIEDGQQLIGTPPMPQRAYFKSQAIFRRLPEMHDRLRALTKEMEELRAALDKRQEP